MSKGQVLKTEKLILNYSIFSMFNKIKFYKDNRVFVDIDVLNKIEKHNVLVYSLSQIFLEEEQIGNFNINNDDKNYLINLFNELIENVNISILSNDGCLSTIQKQQIKNYKQNLFDLISNEKEFNIFLDVNKKVNKDEFTMKFKESMSKSFYYLLNDINYIVELIKNIADDLQIDFESFTEKDELDSLSKLSDSIRKVIFTNTKTTKEVLYKIENLKKMLNKINDFQNYMSSTNIEKELVDIL